MSEETAHLAELTNRKLLQSYQELDKIMEPYRPVGIGGLKLFPRARKFISLAFQKHLALQSPFNKPTQPLSVCELGMGKYYFG